MKRYEWDWNRVGIRTARFFQAQVVGLESVALAGVVGCDVEEAGVEELRLLGSPVERRDQDRLAAAALSEHGDVLFERPLPELHADERSQRPGQR